MTDEPLEERADAEGDAPAKAVDVSAEAADAALPAAEDDLQPTTDPQTLKPILEALIFASPDPLTLKEAASLLVAEASKAEVEQALLLLRHDYEGAGGLQLVEVAGGYQIVTRPDLHEYVRRLFHERTSQKLSVPALETLAVIAYQQPVTAPEIAEIRGVNTSGVLNTLIGRKLVKVVGRQGGGRPAVHVRHDPRLPRQVRPQRPDRSAEGRGSGRRAGLRSAGARRAHADRADAGVRLRR